MPKRLECTHVTLRDHAATSQALNQELRSFERQQVYARTVRQRLQQHGLSGRRLWLRLDAASQKSSMVLSTTNLSARRTRRLFSGENPVFVYSNKMVASVFAASSYRFITWRDALRNPTNPTVCYPYCTDLLCYGKCSAVVLTCTFTKLLTNRKRLTHCFRATGSSPCASHYS
ncbi:hypothetical protein TNCV_2729811 [Trichonephila clavipes]|nr:hypothetical protein TNCV_2729811 [Trichonephila clavipes]